MKAWIRKTGAVSSEPINHRSWKELVDDFDAQLDLSNASEDEEAVIEMWLENPEQFFEREDGQRPSMIRRMTAGRTNVRTASNNIDQEFAAAQAHAASILSKLGNAR